MIFATAAGAQAPGDVATSGDDFDAFRIPAHRSRLGSVSLGAAGTRLASDVPDTRSRSQFGSGLASSVVGARFESEPVQHAWQAGASFEGTRMWRRENQVTPEFSFVSDQEDDDRRTAGRWFVAGGWRRYAGERPIAVAVSAQVVGDYRREWDRGHARTAVPSVVAIRRTAVDREVERHSGQLSVAVGAGRVRDATGVYDARVLEERLRATGAVTRPLSREARHRLAALFYVAPAYASASERPDKFFWRDVEAVLRDDGVLRDGALGAYDVLRALESRHPATLTRLHGYFVGPLLAGSATRHDQRATAHVVQELHEVGAPSVTEARSSSRLDSRDEQILPGARVEGHRAFGSRWQADGVAEVLFPSLHVSKGARALASARLARLVHERWRIALFADFVRAYQSGDPGRPSFDDWTLFVAGEVVYFLQDHLSVDLRWSDRQGRSGPESFSRVGQASLGLRYAFWRGFEAPGLAGPVRPPLPR